MTRHNQLLKIAKMYKWYALKRILNAESFITRTVSTTIPDNRDQFVENVWYLWVWSCGTGLWEFSPVGSLVGMTDVCGFSVVCETPSPCTNSASRQHREQKRYSGVTLINPRPDGGLSHLRHGGGGGQNDPPSNSKTRKARRPGDTAIDSS